MPDLEPNSRSASARASGARAPLPESAETLPPLVRDLIGIIGLQCTTWLVDCFAGIEIRVPGGASEPSRDNRDLHSAIGPAASAALIKRFSGQVITVPTCRDGLLALQREINADQARIARVRESRRDLASVRDTQNMQHLPETAHVLIDVIGLQPTIDLVAACGGLWLKVPIGYRSNAWRRLVEVVGLEAATKLVASRYRGTPLYVPICRDALNLERNRGLLQRLREGATVGDVAQEFRMAKATVYRILQRARGLEQQRAASAA